MRSILRYFYFKGINRNFVSNIYPILYKTNLNVFSRNFCSSNASNKQIIDNNSSIKQQIQENETNQNKNSENENNENENNENESDEVKRKWYQRLYTICKYGSGIAIPYCIFYYIKNEGNIIVIPNSLTNDNKSLPISGKIFAGLPHRSLSRITSYLMDIELPIYLRNPIYKLWGLIYPIEWSEFETDLTFYVSLKEFFIRSLKYERQISLHSVISPCDGKILSFGSIDKNNLELEAIKNVKYRIDTFLGENPVNKLDNENNNLYYVILYLAPGDYHRFHSNSHNFNLNKITHYPGYLYAVKPSWIKKYPGLLSLNERVILSGNWYNNLWYYSYTLVGAYNVGTIHLNFLTKKNESIIETNKKLNKKNNKLFESNIIDFGIPFKIEKGQEIGYFSFGSTIVLIFEATNFEFCIKQNETVKFGQALGEVNHS